MEKSTESSIFAISIAGVKGVVKENVSHAKLVTGHGIEGDAHCYLDRPVSLLPLESFSKVEHPDLILKPGIFAENITTVGLNLSDTKVGDRFQIGEKGIIEVVQIGKECHDMCQIGMTVGKCIMPEEGVFVKAIVGGEIATGDRIFRIESA